MNLREHQITALNEIKQAIKEGHRKIMVGATTSFGKTILAAKILGDCAGKSNRGFMVCDRIKLIEQSLEKFGMLDCGVIQGQHPLAKPWALTQIASVQTLARRRNLPEGRVFIFDEAHTCYKYHIELMQKYDNCIFIGLSATPFSKGLGKHYTKLIVPTTAQELLDKGWLCPVTYYAGEQPDLGRIKLKALKWGGSDYDQRDVSIEYEKPKLIGDVVKTWKEKGKDLQTIAFCPSIKHSKGLVDAFRAAGVPACHVDYHTDPEAREEIYRQHDDGLFKVLSCSSLLNTGYDSPSTKCIIDCYPTKSLIIYVQRVGRIMRIHDDHKEAIYLDHAGNVARHGFAEDIVPESLDMGVKDYDEKELVKDQKEKKPIECECCHAIMKGIKCLVCGHELKTKRRELETVAGELTEVVRFTPEMQEFYSGLLHYAREKGKADGWAYHTYKEKYKRAPTEAKKITMPPNAEVLGFIKHKNIKYAKSRFKANRARDNAMKEMGL